MSKQKIYTRNGDNGETFLVSGTIIKKSDFRLDIYGEIDELNSWLGYITSLLTEKNCFDLEMQFIRDLQQTLFSIGSLLACEKNNWESFKLIKIKKEIIFKTEEHIDLMDTELNPIKHFILPGGTKTSSIIHIARTVCRKIERKILSFYDNRPEECDENTIPFFNRLSDYLFVLARYVDKKYNVDEIFWKS